MRYDFWKKPRNYYAINPEGVPWDAFHYKPSADTLAEAVAREHALTRAIQADPFKHIPHGLRQGWLGRNRAFGKDWLNMGQGIVWTFAKPSRARIASGTLGDAGPS